MKKARKRRLALLMAAFMLFTNIFGNVSMNSYADNAPERSVIASCVVTEENAPAEKPSGYSDVNLTLCDSAEFIGLTKNGYLTGKNFMPGAYWETVVNASEFESVGLSLDYRMSKTGPKDFVFEYALDDSAEFSVLKQVSAALDEKNAVTGTFTLDPSETAVLSGHSFKLRLTVAAGALAVNGKEVAAGGTMGINNIVFTGVKTGSTPIDPIDPVDPVCGSVYVVDGKTTVKAGETVSLACDTEGASIFFNVNGTENFSLYEAPIVITEDTVIKAFAQAEGYQDSEVSSFAITVEVEKPDPVVTLPFEDGDTVAIVVSDMALTTEVVSNKFLGGSAVTKDGDNVVLPTEAATLKVVVSEEGVAFVDVATNKYLATTEAGNTLFFQDELSAGALWILEETEGGWLVKSVASKDAAKPQYIEWYSSKSDFTTYGYNEKYKSAYVANFYKTTGVDPIDPIDPIDPVDPLPFKDGDTVAIVVSDMALTTAVKADKYLEGAAVTKDGDNVVLPEGAATLKVVVSEEGVAFLDAENNKYLATTEKGNTLFFQDELNAGALWILEETEGGWLVKSVASKDAAKPQYIEWYSSKSDFTTYGYNEKYKSAYVANFYQIATVVPDDTLPFKNGDTVAIVIADTAVTAKVKSTKYLDGSAVTKDGDKVVLPSDAAVHKAIVSEEGVAFLDVDTNKYLATTAAGNTIFYQDELNEGALWILEKEEGGWLVKSAASKDAAKPQYIEWNSKYSDFTTYGYNEKYKSDYLANFYYVDTTYKIDTDTVIKVAQWGGGGPYDDSQRVVYADLIESNDFLDTAKEFVAVVNGTTIAPFTTGTTQNGTNYYMGGKGIGSGSDDYMQFKLSSFGYGKMKLSFRLRASGTGAGAFTLKYSVNGTDFADFTTGTAHYTDKNYTTGEESAYDYTLTDGVAKIYKSGLYIEYSFDVPGGAENAKELYVRFVPSDTAANGNSIQNGGTVRIDSVTFTGSPIVSSDMCGYVKVAPQAGAVASGTELTMSSATADAAIYYSINGGEYVQYNAESKPVLDTLPAFVRTYASNGTLTDSIVTNNYYTQLKCEGVTAKPNGGAVVLNEKVRLTALTEGADILYRFSDSEVWIKYTEPVKITELPCQMYVKSVKEGCLDSEVKTLNFTEKTNEKYNIYFGQLHSHTQFSDGSGTCEEAFAHATRVANLDFLAVTDHSNSLDHEAESKIDTNVDTKETDEWTLGHSLAKKYSSETFTCLYGYEMTWSNGLGHMNTYNTPGFQSRTQKQFTTYSTALNNYYSALETVPDSISMFNHPGTTFGDFQDFAYYTPARDELINLIEVGNGEGAIGSSGYFPSYEYYTRALDKGWHIAPTNNQDNHKGLWGDANTARSVVLASANTEEEIYQAMKDRRMYATEDNDLSIYYTLDGHILGTILDKEDVGEEVELKVEVSDPDNESIGTVEVIVNGGLSVASKVVNGSEDTVTFKLPSTYSYYYIKITQGDKDIAVTAPVWVGEVEACGINSVSTETTLPVKGENIDINIDFFNNETVDLEVNEITIDILDAEGALTRVATLSGEDLAAVAAVKSNSTASVSFNYVYGSAGKITYIVNATAKLAGADKLYTGKLTVNYAAPEMVGEVLIDASHSNDYVAGYYMNNVNNLISMCAKHNLRASLIKDSVDSSDLTGAKLLVISSPGLDDTRNNPPLYSHKTFEPEFIEAVREYVESGGSVIICGIADYNNYQAGVQTNALLEGIGSTIRINSDEVMDDSKNGGQAYRLYPENFNMDSPFMKGVYSVDANPKKFQVYSQYSGCSIDVSNAVENDVVYAAEKLVWGFDTTYSVDCKDDQGNKLYNADGSANIKNDNMGDITFLAHQKTKAGGDIFVAGGVFCSDFEVKAEIDNNDSLPYANATIVENILENSEVALTVSTIKEARQGNTGDVFCVEGYVTAGTANEYNTFFDTIYIQDETGGIDIFPYAEAGLELGTKVRIVGYVSSYQGDLELKVITAKILPDEKKIVDPTVLSTEEAMDYAVHGGELVKTEGTVTRVLVENGSLSEFWLKDATGKEAAIFIDGYIFSGTTGENNLAEVVKEGATVSAVGVLYMHPEGSSDVSVPVLRVRDCDEIIVTAVEPKELRIVKEPEDFFATTSGISAELKVEVEGEGLSYNWYYKAPNGDGKFHKAGQYTDTFVRTSGTRTDGLEAYCVITDANGNKVVTRTAKIVKAKVVAESLNGAVLEANRGEKVEFKVSAEALMEKDGEIVLSSDAIATYRWYVRMPEELGGDGKFHKAGDLGDTYVRTAGRSRNGMQVYCKIIDIYGNYVTTEVTTLVVR